MCCQSRNARNSHINHMRTGDTDQPDTTPTTQKKTGTCKRGAKLSTQRRRRVRGVRGQRDSALMFVRIEYIIRIRLCRVQWFALRAHSITQSQGVGHFCPQKNMPGQSRIVMHRTYGQKKKSPVAIRFCTCVCVFLSGNEWPQAYPGYFLVCARVRSHERLWRVREGGDACGVCVVNSSARMRGQHVWIALAILWWGIHTILHHSN